MKKRILILLLISLLFSFLSAQSAGAGFFDWITGKATKQCSLFSEDFNSVDEWDFSNAQGIPVKLGNVWSIADENGDKILKGTGHNWADAGDERWTNYVFKTNIKVMQGNVHINFRKGYDGRYFLRFGQDGLYLIKQFNQWSEFAELKRLETPVALNQWHALVIEVSNNNIKVYANNTLKIDYTDTAPLTSGSIAFETGDNSVVYFDDIRVDGDCVGEAQAPTLPIEPAPIGLPVEPPAEKGCYFDNENFVCDSYKITTKGIEVAIRNNHPDGVMIEDLDFITIGELSSVVGDCPNSFTPRLLNGNSVIQLDLPCAAFQNQAGKTAEMEMTLVLSEDGSSLPIKGRMKGAVGGVLAETCTDTDGGKDYYTNGLVNVQNVVYNDACGADGKHLLENFCLNGGRQVEEFGCPEKCMEGACVCDNDGICDSEENSQNCPNDCKEIFTKDSGYKIYDEDFSNITINYRLSRGGTITKNIDCSIWYVNLVGLEWYLDPWENAKGVDISEENGNKYLALSSYQTKSNTTCRGFISFAPFSYIAGNFSIESNIKLNDKSLNFQFSTQEQAYDDGWGIWDYSLEINEEKLILTKSHSDSRTGFYEKNVLAETPFDTNNWHTVKVTKLNNRIKVDIDRENRIDFTDSNPYEVYGRINFVTGDGQADLDDWKIFDLEHKNLNHKISLNINKVEGNFKNMYSCGTLWALEDPGDPNCDPSYCQESGFFTGLFEETEPIAQRLKNTNIEYWRVRGIGNKAWLGDGIYVTQAENGSVNINFSELDATINLIKSLGKEPFIRLGFALPLFLVNCTRPGCEQQFECTNWSECGVKSQTRTCEVIEDCGDNNIKPVTERLCGSDTDIINNYELYPNQEVVGCPPRNFSQWEDIIYQMVKHYNVDRRDNINYWTVWNEPDLQYFGGGGTGKFDELYGNNLGMKENYLKLYEYAVKGALRADSTIKIGGPAIAGGNDAPGSGNDLLKALLDYCSKNNIRLDFIDFHRYIDPMNSQHPAYYEKLVDYYKNLTLQYGLNPEIIIAESGVAGGSAESSAGRKDEKTASFLSAMIHYQMKGGADLSCSAYFNDLFVLPGIISDCLMLKGFAAMPFIIGNKFLTTDFYVYDMLTELSKGGQKLSVSIDGKDDVSDEDSVGSLATKADDGTVRILVWRYEIWRNLNKSVDLLVSGLPSSPVTVDTYLIDKEHNNPYTKCLENPEAFGQNIEESLEKLSSQIVDVANSQISLPLNLEDYSVMLIVIKRNETGCVCTALYDPVCGSDEKTYSNSCFAGCGNVNVACKGECPCGQISGCSGCLNNEGRCIPYGIRAGAKYCDLSGSFVGQKKEGKACGNNFECSTNICINDKCIGKGVWEKFLKWFNKIFGKKMI